MSSEEATALDTIFGMGVYADIKIGDVAKLKVQGFYYFYGLKWITRWDESTGQYLNGRYYHRKGLLKIDYGVNPFYQGAEFHIDYYEEYGTGKVIIAGSFSYYRYWSKSLKIGSYSGIGASFKAEIDLTASFVMEKGELRVKKIVITIFGEVKTSMKATVWWAVLYEINVSGKLYAKLIIDLYDLIYTNKKQVKFEV